MLSVLFAYLKFPLGAGESSGTRESNRQVEPSQRAHNIKSSVLFTIRKRFIDFMGDADE